MLGMEHGTACGPSPPPITCFPPHLLVKVHRLQVLVGCKADAPAPHLVPLAILALILLVGTLAENLH